MTHYLLAIDQGTTNSRAIVFNREGVLLSQHEIPLNQFFPEDGWVEQNPLEMFNNTVNCCKEAISKLTGSIKEIAAIGISNQRETTIIWDRQTGIPIYPAIVWQDRRTNVLCQTLRSHPIASKLQEKTGLLLDPYFSATKILWILDNIPNARKKAEQGELAFGTVDTFLIWHFTKGKSHYTDATNASRTMLFNIKTQQWDKEILAALNIPASLLPTVLDCSADYGDTDISFFGIRIPIRGVAGDQQAATIGQACFEKGMVKTTYGTGGFMLLNTGDRIIHSQNQLLSTIAYRLNNQVTYGLEGSFFCAGATIKWLRDNLKLIKTAKESETLANNIPDNGGVYLVPAFTGLGAPYWDPTARGAILGLTRSSGIEHIVRAALEAVAYQTYDLLAAMQKDSQTSLEVMRVDGGMVENHWLLQFVSDMLNLTIERPDCVETSALGAAYLAGLSIGMYQSTADIATHWKMNLRAMPKMLSTQREMLYNKWTRAVQSIALKINAEC